jgi:hypothetical protein
MKSLVLCALGAVLGLVVGCSAPPPSAALPVATEASPALYADLLARYATPEGVRYSAWKASPADRRALEEVTAFYANTRPPESSREAALAWHLNAYNAWMLRAMLDRFPVGGPLDGTPEFFKTPLPVISGQTISFDELEQKRIRPVFNEPRVHFALNCASRSCPPLSTLPFAEDGLNEHLDTLTKAFVNSPAVTAEGGSVRLSRIFDWYAVDFGGKDKIVRFVNPFRTEKLAESAPTVFAEYDWALNAVP